MSLFTIPKPADRREWLEARRPFFNASAAGALYGCHPFISLADVVAEKLAPEVTDNGQTEAMERGDRLEPVLLEWFGDRHGLKVVAPDVLYVNDRLMATLDGEPVGETDSWVEAKTTAHRWDEVPDHVRWQVTAQAAASGKKTCFVVWIDADMRYKQQTITPAPEQIADVLERASRFMDFIDLGMTPEGVELSADHLRAMFPEPEPGKWNDVDDDDYQRVILWAQAREQRLAAEKRENAAKDEVAQLVGDAEGLKFHGLPIATWKANKPGRRLDTKALEARYPRAVARFYRDVTGARVLRPTRELGTFFGEASG